jgi:hypothetical protein
MWWSRVAAPRAIAGLHRSLYSVLAAGLFAVPLWSVPTAGRPAAIATATLLVITIRNPDDGLLIVAGLLPLAAPIGRLFRLQIRAPDRRRCRERRHRRRSGAGRPRA